MLFFFHKLKSYGISAQIFGLISSFLSNRWHQVVLDGKSSQEYPVTAGVPQGSIPGPTLGPKLWNSLLIKCFPLTYDLSGFKSRINRYLLTVGSF